MIDRVQTLHDIARTRVAASPVPDQRYGLSVFLRRPLPDMNSLHVSHDAAFVVSDAVQGSLADAPDRIVDVLMRDAARETPLAFHMATTQQVQILDIEPGTTQSRSLPHLAASGACQTLLARIGRGASLTVHETSSALANEGAYGSALLLIDIGPEASLVWNAETVDRENAVVRNVVARVQERGRMAYAHAVLASSHVMERQHVVLDGEGAYAALNGVMLGQGTDQHDVVATAEHRGRATTSRLAMKGAFGGRAQGILRGHVTVHGDANGADGDQRIHSLLLSEKAEVDAVPNLEIATHDVRCTHGATTGHLDREQLFYLESRGLPREAAVQLLVQGFLGETLAPFAPEDRDRLEGRMAASLDAEWAEGNA